MEARRRAYGLTTRVTSTVASTGMRRACCVRNSISEKVFSRIPKE